MIKLFKQTVRISNSDKISLISNLYTMLSTGIPILEAVDSIGEDAKGGTKKILDTLKEDITQGRRIHTSFTKFPEVFDKVTVNVIKASEEAGTLDVTLKDIRDNIRKQIEFSDKIKSSLAYPVFIGIVFVGMMIVNLFIVMPKISMVFKSLRVTLPLPTKILIYTSDALIKNPLPIAGGVLVFLVILIFLFTQKRRWIMNIIYSLPLVSNLIKLIDLTQFSRSLYLLLSSGIPIVEALDLTSETVMRRDTHKILDKTKEMVLTGKPLSQGLRTSKGYIPIIMIKLIEAGEKTGTLDRSMQDISVYFDYQVTNTLKTLMTLLEPVMLVVVGVVVGGMMLAIIAPIYSVIGTMGSVR